MTVRPGERKLLWKALQERAASESAYLPEFPLEDDSEQMLGFLLGIPPSLSPDPEK